MTHFIKLLHLLIACCVIWIGSISSANAYTSASDLPASNHPTDYEKNWASNLGEDLNHDVRHYMDGDNIFFFGGSFLTAGILANTGLDRAFADHWQTDIKSKTTKCILAYPKAIGGLSFYYAPIFLTTMAAGHLREHTLLGNVLYNWGYRSFRTFIIGGLQQCLLTHLLGNGRPNINQDSKWQPFRYSTGCSGHAFYGAVPFLTAAMMSDPPLLKYSLYVLSTLPAVSRVNDNKHYLSQVILGWTIAFLTSRSVYRSDLDRKPPFQVHVYPKSDGAMLGAHLEF